jgi:hypothetical protein
MPDRIQKYLNNNFGFTTLVQASWKCADVLKYGHRERCRAQKQTQLAHPREGERGLYCTSNRKDNKPQEM